VPGNRTDLSGFWAFRILHPKRGKMNDPVMQICLNIFFVFL